VGELKRMYETATHRRLGIARAVLEVQEAEAKRLRFGRIVLETGERSPAALALYQFARWVPIDPEVRAPRRFRSQGVMAKDLDWLDR
jgi:GNAT superfamily N-acetyltransferase